MNGDSPARRVETATLNLYINRYLAEAEGSHDLALALAFDRHGKELDRLRRYEHAITRAFDRILEKLGKLIKVRHLLQAQAAREAADLEPGMEDSMEEFGFVSDNFAGRSQAVETRTGGTGMSIKVE